MLSIQELLDLRIGKLKTAVGDWEEVSRRLRKLATGDNSAATLNTAADRANWRGADATASRQFIRKTAAEFTDAATTATSIHAILRDAQTSFTRHKDELNTAIADATKRNIYIDEKGHAIPPSPPPGVVSDESKLDRPSDAEVAAAERDVARILREADETDRIAARALRALARNKHDFSGTKVDGLKSADGRQGAADAKYWAEKIAKGNVEDWSDEELKRFNETLAAQRNNEAFTELFATKLGADGTLQFWRDLAAPAGGDVDDERAKLLGRTQDSLSMSLASATNIDSTEMHAWKKDMLAAGSKMFPLDGMPTGPYGYQVMSSLMHKGKFESKFLKDYGTQMLEFERTRAGETRGADPDFLWRDSSTLNYPPADEPNDPVDGYLEALSRNPEASLDFFRNGSTGGGESKLDEVTNWDYLVEQGDSARTWPEGENSHKYLGHALESATLGYAYDDKSPGAPALDKDASEKEKAAWLEAREERVSLMSQVVSNYSSTETIDAQPGIRDSLARMASGHIDSINYSMDNFGGAAAVNGRDGLFGSEKNHLSDFGSEQSASFLKAVATEKSAYDTVSSAQQAYGASLMAAQGDSRTDALDAGVHSAMMHGLLDEVRAEAIGSEFADDKTRKDLELEKQGAWRNYAAGAVVGVGVGAASGLVVPAGVAAAIAVPIAFETAGGAVETHMANQTTEWLKKNEFNNSNESFTAIRDSVTEGQWNAMHPLLSYAESNGMPAHEARLLAERAQARYIAGTDTVDTEDARGH